jgi:MFS transporter, SP family, galactose:H+ symporter
MLNTENVQAVSSGSDLSRKLFMFFTIACGGLGGILYGYDIGVISGALLFIQKSIALTQNQTGFVVGAVLIGSVAGTLITGPLADFFGRKKMIIFACLLFMAGIFLILIANGFYSLLGARLLLGIAVGVVSVAAPLYLTETAPAHLRGRSVTIFQLLLTFGIVMAYFVDLLFVPSGNWRGMFAVILVPTTVLLIGMMLLPETPRWLMVRHRDRVAARKVLLKTHTMEEAQNALQQIEATILEDAAASGKKASWKALFARNLYLPLTVAMVIAICNQLTGINVLLQYAPLVIKEAGLTSEVGTMLGTVGFGLVNFLMTILAFFLIDRCGRRILLLVGTAGVAVSYIYLGMLPHFVSVGQLQAGLSLVGLFSYISFYAIGPGVVVWLAISELLPTKVRGQAIAVCLFANSLTSAILSTVFLMIQNSVGIANTYLLFALSTCVYFLTALFYLPETKNKTLEEIQQFYKQETNQSVIINAECE